jgi:hypothetical protein
MLRIVAGTDLEPVDDEATEPTASHASMLIQHAHIISNLLEGDVAAFFIVGIRSDGSHSTGWRLDPDNPFMGSTLFGTFVAEIARREIITQSEVVDVLNRGPTTSDHGA